MKRDSRMTGNGKETSDLLASRRGTLLFSLSQLFAASNESENGHVRQQLLTALTLLEVGLKNEDPAVAGQQFGAWLKIAIKQRPERFIDEAAAAERIDALSSNWGEALGDAGLLAESLLAAKALLQDKSPRVARALFIGDCLLWDASLQLQIAAQSKGVVVEPTIMAQRIGADLRRELAKRKENEFNMVVYSPFTYEFSSEYAFATSALAILKAPRRTAQLLDAALEDAKKTIEMLAAHFECPIYVHTVSGIVQSHPGWRGVLKRLATSPARHWASSKLDKRLSCFIGVLNEGCDRPVARIDERNAGATVSTSDLGVIAFQAGELHPTRLAFELARGPYLLAARVSAQLADKKLIVCDLDNTLWEGLIGEGAVRHHVDRQQTLLSLKSRGIVLAVASKNDPANIRWGGAHLSEEDFVARKINWGPKSASILAIANELNLKATSFVFLDDRPDEREMASTAVPGLVALDPNDAETWKMLELWASIMPRSALQDRTRMYRARAEREQFLNSIAVDSEEVAESYRSLCLKLSLRHPADREMSRVVELINRTNQFNTTGARVTRAEVGAAPESRRILIAEISDKFGEMGIVGVLVMALGAPWRITHFVLSCRVFGYGIEDAMLNAVKRWMQDGVAIEATLLETSVNGPCRDVYARNGFERQSELWVLRAPGVTEDLEWLAIDDQTGGVASTVIRAA
jgi:FkbH-like protein